MSYQKELARVLLDRGFLAEEPEVYGGFLPVKATMYKHVGQKLPASWSGHPLPLQGALPKCGKWISLIEVDEETASRFVGTFEDNQESYIVSGKLTCECKTINGVKVYYDGTMSNLMREVTRNVNYLD